MSQSLNIVFMGTPEFSVPTLQALHESEHRVSLVVTRTDKPKGRGRKVVSPPIKIAADQMGYETLQAKSAKTDEFAERLESIAPDVLVVIAYGQILPPRVLNIPSLLPINVHASLLPLYRGPAPIQWAVINGDHETGITTMKMAAGMDTGDILLTAKEKILPDDTAATLHDRLARLGAKLLIETLDVICADRLVTIPQDDSLATYAPMLKKSDGLIPWHKPARELANFVRGMNPWPGAFTHQNEQRLKIFNAIPLPDESEAIPGTVVEGFPDELRVATGKGLLLIREIQGTSGKRLKMNEYLHGHPIPPGTLFK